MADGPSTVAMYSVWAYWLGVLLMTVRVRLQGASSAGMVPKQPLERLMWIVWVPVIAAWIVFPWLSIHRSSPPWLLPDPALVEPAWYALRWVAAGLTVACLIGTIFCWRWMGRSWRVGVDADQQIELITTGPFSGVRHPIYTRCCGCMATHIPGTGSGPAVFSREFSPFFSPGVYCGRRMAAICRAFRKSRSSS
jgi:hypothetical protein